MDDPAQQTPEPEVVRYRKHSWNLPAFLVCVIGGLGFGAAALIKPAWGIPALVFGAGAMIFAIRLITEKPFHKAFLEITGEGVRVHPDDDRPARFIAWEILHDISHADDRGELHFRLLNADWRVLVPAGVPEPDALPARIIALRPAHIPPALAHDADAALDAAFGFRTPEGARMLYFVHHHDGTARWDLHIPDAILHELRSTRLRCSAWYPLPPDMKFGLGSARPARDDIPDQADYAIGEGHGHERTPVLIHDPRTHRLICMLVNTMG